MYSKQIPYLAPEAVLFLKARIRGESPRAKNRLDFFRVLAVLSKSQNAWLKTSIYLETTDPPWLLALKAEFI